MFELWESDLPTTTKKQIGKWNNSKRYKCVDLTRLGDLIIQSK